MIEWRVNAIHFALLMPIFNTNKHDCVLQIHKHASIRAIVPLTIQKQLQIKREIHSTNIRQKKTTTEKRHSKMKMKTMWFIVVNIVWVCVLLLRLSHTHKHIHTILENRALFCVFQSAIRVCSHSKSINK